MIITRRVSSFGFRSFETVGLTRGDLTSRPRRHRDLAGVAATIDRRCLLALYSTWLAHVLRHRPIGDPGNHLHFTIARRQHARPLLASSWRMTIATASRSSSPCSSTQPMIALRCALEVPLHSTRHSASRPRRGRLFVHASNSEVIWKSRLLATRAEPNQEGAHDRASSRSARARASVAIANVLVHRPRHLAPDRASRYRAPVAIVEIFRSLLRLKWTTGLAPSSPPRGSAR